MCSVGLVGKRLMSTGYRQLLSTSYPSLPTSSKYLVSIGVWTPFPGLLRRYLWVQTPYSEGIWKTRAILLPEVQGEIGFWSPLASVQIQPDPWRIFFSSRNGRYMPPPNAMEMRIFPRYLRIINLDRYLDWTS